MEKCAFRPALLQKTVLNYKQRMELFQGNVKKSRNIHERSIRIGWMAFLLIYTVE